MEYSIGLMLAVAVAGSAVIIGLDRERSFYATVAIVVATYYVLFAVQGASTRILVYEVIAACIFSAIAVLGFRTNLWFVAAAIAGHGGFDFVHGLFIENPGLPLWWPGFCGAFDVIFGGFLAMRLLSRSGFELNRIVKPERGYIARP